MSDPFTAAWEEAIASVPQDVVVFYTLEFRHPAFIENEVAVAVRVVTDTPDDQLFRIEVGAEMNAGEIAKFIAVPFRAAAPTFAEGQMPETQITIDNAGRELIPRLEAAVTMRADLDVVYREYRSDDRNEPCYGPIAFVMRNVAVSGASVTGTAKLDDLANSKFPRGVYTIARFPGLGQ